MEEKKAKILSKYFCGKTALVVCNTSMGRQTTRKFVESLGFISGTIHCTDNYVDAESLMLEHLPAVVISDFEIGTKSAIDLLKVHQKLVPDRTIGTFCLLYDEGNLEAELEAKYNECDAMVAKPYNIAGLEESFLKGLSGKIKPSDYRVLLEKARISFSKGDYEVAKDFLQEAKIVNSEDPNAYYLMSKIWQKENNTETCLEYLTHTIEKEKYHFCALLNIINLYIDKKEYLEAYQYLMIFNKVHTPPPKMVPDFLRIYMVAKRYDEIIGFCKPIIQKIEKYPFLKKPLAASLVVSANFMVKMKAEKLKVLEVIKLATLIVEDNIKIITGIVNSLVDIQEYDEAEKLLKKVPEDLFDENLYAVDLELTHLSMGSGVSIKKAMEYFNNHKNKHYKVFNVLIESSIEIGRKDETILELIEDACAKYPDLEDHYNQYRSRLTEKKTA